MFLFNPETVVNPMYVPKLSAGYPTSRDLHHFQRAHVWHRSSSKSDDGSSVPSHPPEISMSEPSSLSSAVKGIIEFGGREEKCSNVEKEEIYYIGISNKGEGRRKVKRIPNRENRPEPISFQLLHRQSESPRQSGARCRPLVTTGNGRKRRR